MKWWNKQICYWFGHKFITIEKFGFPGLHCKRCDFITFGGKTHLTCKKMLPPIKYQGPNHVK